MTWRRTLRADVSDRVDDLGRTVSVNRDRRLAALQLGWLVAQANLVDAVTGENNLADRATVRVVQ